MSYLKQSKTFILCLGVLVMIFLLNYLVLAWTEPSENPPGGNVPAPLNVGVEGQQKAGGLILNTGNATTGLIVLGDQTNPSGGSCSSDYQWYDWNSNGAINNGECVRTVLTVNRNAIAVNNNRITKVAAPVDSLDAVNKEYVDAASGGTPLQNTMQLYENYSYPISTVSIAVPKIGCSVKFTVCSVTTPPTQMIIGADPVPRSTKARINETTGVIASAGITAASGGAGCGGATNCGTNMWGDYACYYTPFYCSRVQDHCQDGVCCPSGYNQAAGGYCADCNTKGYLVDWEDILCYKEPRCPAADAGTVFAAEDDTDNLCAYCPNDHPTYDVANRSCIKSATVNTMRLGASGRCSVLSTILNTTHTDVTFSDGSGQAKDIGGYVQVSYSCPQ